MKPPVSASIAGSKRTVLAASHRHDGILEPITPTAFQALNVEWPAFAAQAQTNAEQDRSKLQIEYVRDAKKIIVYAVVRSAEGLIGSAVLAPKFLENFAGTLGEKVILAVPSRSTAYVFPALASQYADYAPMVLEAYRATTFPISTEVFELSAGGFRAVGIYEAP